MNFPKHEINQAIAWDMNVPAGADYLDDDQEHALVFKRWAMPRLDDDQREVFDMLRGMYGDTVALVSALQIMDRWTAQL